MTFTSLRARLPTLLALLLAGALATALLVVNEFASQRAARAMADLADAIEVRLTLATLRRQLLQAESAQRGFLITAKEEYAKPYAEALAALDATQTQLRRHYFAGREGVQDYESLLALIERKLSELALTMRLRGSGREQAWRRVVETDIGRNLMLSIDSAIVKLLDTEQRRITEHHEVIREALAIGHWGTVAMTFLGILAFAFYLRQTTRIADARRRQAEAVQRERDQLEAQVAQRTRELSELASHLVTAREDERARLARELHDELGALFTTAKLDVARLKSRLRDATPEAVERLTHLNETLNSGVALKRRIIEDLRPSSLSNLGLVAALEHLAREFASRTDARVETAFDPVELPDATELTVFRLVQEALTNISKHAAARHVRITLRALPAHAQVTVEDDGRGFDPAAQAPASHGLVGMRFRIESAGGRCTIASRPGVGTRIEAMLPLLPAPQAASA